MKADREHPTLTWRGCVRSLAPGTHFLVAEVHRLQFGPVKSLRWCALDLLCTNAAWTTVSGVETFVRRPVRNERLHTERQTKTFGFMSSVSWQVQLVSSHATSGSVLWRVLPKNNRRWRSLRRIHYARLRCHTTNFPAALSVALFVFACSVSEICIITRLRPTLRSCVVNSSFCLFYSAAPRVPLSSCLSVPNVTPRDSTKTASDWLGL